jgi:formate C-acetyltransferase
MGSNDYITAWPKEDSIKKEGWDISEQDIADVISMNEYWKHRNLISRIGVLFDEERLWPFMQTGMVLPPWKTREEGSGGGYAESGLGLGPGFYLCSLTFDRVLQEGFSPLIKEAEEGLRNIRMTHSDSVTKAYFLKAVILSLLAISRFSLRFSLLAKELASKEPNPQRKKELEKISESCEQVPAHPQGISMRRSSHSGSFF